MQTDCFSRREDETESFCQIDNLLSHSRVANMFTDRHFPSSFLSGNPSLRDMVKDKGDFDRRLDDINKRQVERRRQEKRDEPSASDSMFSMTSSGSTTGPRLYQPYNSRAFKQELTDRQALFLDNIFGIFWPLIHFSTMSQMISDFQCSSQILRVYELVSL